MLDTSVASHVIRGDRPELTRRLTHHPIDEIVVSAVTEGELLFGVARRGYPTALTERVRQFLLRARSLTWDSAVARVYAEVRAACQAKGVGLAAIDMMIAGHAVAVGAVLVTNDQAFGHVGAPFVVEDWLGA